MMKRIIALMACAVGVLLLSSCHSTEVSYKQTYDKIKEQKIVESTTAVSGAVKPQEVKQTDNETVAGITRERDNYVSGAKTMDNFGIVAGSFKLKVTAEDLCDRLVDMGYKKSSVVLNPVSSFYRVLVATYPDFDTAKTARDEFRTKHPERKEFQSAWLVMLMK
jgi:hypothetical protein